ncbi:MAG TPA: glycogen debranching N-terminal domain-containing protein [Vicinamibacterales bacterium]|nr:glycogen debranching N-terminal domain-containing protein [Vicinamibacterales bacterium]
MPSPSDLQAHGHTRHQHGTRRVVQHGRASTTSSIARAIVIKRDELFFLCNRDGDVPIDESHGLGLYYHDCRYLNGYELRVGATPADRLASTAASGHSATFELTNPDLKTPSGELLEKERIAIKWERTLESNPYALRESIGFTNFGPDKTSLPVTIRLRSTFESLFEVRGAQAEQRGTLRHPHWVDDTLQFTYDGADRITRTLAVSFAPPPHRMDGTTAEFALAIDAQQTATVRVTLQISESGGQPRQTGQGGVSLTSATHVLSTSTPLNRVLNRSLLDLHLLRTTLRDHQYFAAGVPWYVTLFGRDSIIASLESLAFLPETAEATVRLLASLQGTRDDAWRDEAPGKIMHELRVGEMAHLNEIPQTPYYGSVDATPLFLILVARHAAWTGRLDLFDDVRAHIERALAWIDDEIAEGGTGYLTYATRSAKGLSNQGWKDSGDSIVNQDGSLATAPIALVEVQAYVYAAKHGIADLYSRAGDSATADRLRREADGLRDRFERDFWLEDLGTYALALQRDGRPAAVVSSNPGHALWAGIVRPDRAATVAARMLRDDMFSGWGIRTLSSQERRYNPVSYHDGTVWPHDNALAVAGFQRYGCGVEAARVMTGIIDAAVHFDHDRLPEVFAGFSRDEFEIPVHYPVACHPQAWAAGAVPFMLTSVLGFEPDAASRHLRINRPALPESIHVVTISGLRVGDATVSATFRRTAPDRVAVEDVTVDGRLDVSVT